MFRQVSLVSMDVLSNLSESRMGRLSSNVLDVRSSHHPRLHWLSAAFATTSKFLFKLKGNGAGARHSNGGVVSPSWVRTRSLAILGQVISPKRPGVCVCGCFFFVGPRQAVLRRDKREQSYSERKRADCTTVVEGREQHEQLSFYGLITGATHRCHGVEDAKGSTEGTEERCQTLEPGVDNLHSSHSSGVWVQSRSERRACGKLRQQGLRPEQARREAFRGDGCGRSGQEIVR